MPTIDIIVHRYSLDSKILLIISLIFFLFSLKKCCIGGLAFAIAASSTVGTHDLLKGEVVSFMYLFLAKDVCDVTISALPTNHNTIYSLFRQSIAFVHMFTEP